MQATKHILLIKPSNFTFNSETAASNAFQKNSTETQELVSKNVLNEFETFVTTLKSKGINVTVVDDTPSPPKPDAIFPNNWISFHEDGTVVLYPMFAPNRRLERRRDVIDLIKKDYTITKIVDFSPYESKNVFLEGTGSIVFDHQNKIAYACLSPRTNKELLIDLCYYINYKPVYFFAYDKGGKQIYHTNVMMCIAEKFVAICMDSITDKKEKEMLRNSFLTTGHVLIDISFEQMNNFAGNMLALQTIEDKNILVLSQSADDSLTTAQKEQIKSHCELVPLSIKTIETIGGGSARCMIAEIFLPPVYQ